MSFSQTVALGALAGFTIYLGLPLARLQILGSKMRVALAMFSVGVLAFLFVDVIAEATHILEGSVEGFKDGNESFGHVMGMAALLAGGFFLGLADFPLLLSIKLKLLFDIGALYGYPGEDYKERLYLLHVFQLAFSSDAHRLDVYRRISDWRTYSQQLPASLDDFDWRTFQQEYRDYIDLAKLMQLVPIIGAPVGVVVNNRLVQKLGETAINAYRMRWFDEGRTEPVLQLPGNT